MANDKVKNALTMLENGILNLVDSGRWKDFLVFQSAFHNYSFNNQIMIWSQKPTATRVAGFTTWKKLKRFVKKGEKGIQILAPMQIKVTEQNAEGDDEEKLLRLYRIVHVFDVAQTEGEPLPSLVDRLEGDFELYHLLKALCPFPVEELDDCDGANGYYSLKTKSIALLSSLSQAHKSKTLIHEWVHGLLHDKWKEKGDLLDSKTMEVEAESSAFVVCNSLGLDTSSYSFGYVASWGGGKEAIKRLRASGDRIQKVASEILKAVNGEQESQDDEVELAS